MEITLVEIVLSNDLAVSMRVLCTRQGLWRKTVKHVENSQANVCLLTVGLFRGSALNLFSNAAPLGLGVLLLAGGNEVGSIETTAVGVDLGVEP